MTNLIVGGTGLIGGHLAEYFFKEGEISKGIFRKGSHLKIMDQCGVQCLEADLNDRNTLHEPLDMVEAIYNLASPPPTARDEEFAKFGKGLNNLLEEANEHGVKTFVHLSCLDVYGNTGPITDRTVPNPKDGYQRAKLDAENTVIAFGQKNPDLKMRVVRAARVVGPRDKTITVPILRMAESGKVLLPREASKPMALSHPKDLAQALLRAASYSGGIQSVLVKSFDASLEEYSKAILAASSKKAEIKQAGLMSGKTIIPEYAQGQIRALRTIGNQDSWSKMGFAPSYTVQRTAEEVSEWLRKDPWATKDLE